MLPRLKENTKSTKIRSIKRRTKITRSSPREKGTNANASSLKNTIMTPQSSLKKLRFPSLPRSTN